MEEFVITVNGKGHLTRRESFDLEFKQAFHYGDSLHEYVRSLVGMANNRGGQIIFGIQDSPRIPVGLQNDKFENLDPTKLNAVILEYFSSDLSYVIESFEWDGKAFGVLKVSEARVKPLYAANRMAENFEKVRSITGTVGKRKKLDTLN